MPSEVKVFHSLKSVFKERLETIYLDRVTWLTMPKIAELVCAIEHSGWENILLCRIVMALFD